MKKIVFLMALSALAWPTLRSTGHAVTLSFLDTATVKGPEVRLGEVAIIQGAPPEQLENFSQRIVARFLIPGRSRKISTHSILNSALKGENIQALNLPSVIYVIMESQKVPAAEIRQRVEAFVWRHLPWPRENVGLSFARETEEILLPNRPYQIEVKNKDGYDYKGSGRLRVIFLQQNREIEITDVALHIEVSADVVVAAFDISRNARIRQDDLMLQKLNITCMRSQPFMDAEKLVGLRAKRMIRSGRILDPTMVEVPPLFTSGEPVRLYVQKGQTLISAEGQSRAEGYTGKVIPVFCLATKKILYGRVQENGSVQIDENRRTP